MDAALQISLAHDILERGEDALVDTPELVERRQGFWGAVTAVASNFVSVTSSFQVNLVKEAKSKADQSDPIFVRHMADALKDYPMLKDGVELTELELERWIRKKIELGADDAAKKIHDALLKALAAQLQETSRLDAERQSASSRTKFLQELQSAYSPEDSGAGLVFEQMQFPDTKGAKGLLKVTACQTFRTEFSIAYTIHPLALTEFDAQELRSNPHHVPTPQIQSAHDISFELSLSHRVRHIQRVGRDKYFLLVDCMDKCKIFLEDQSNLTRAVAIDSTKRVLPYERLSRDFVFAFDESKRVFALCWLTKESPYTLQMQVYVFDETYSSMNARQSPINLTPWYETVPRIRHLMFVVGSEELCLIDQSGRARVFSLVTEQFRPAFLQLHKDYAAILTTPDGSCLLAIQRDREAYGLQAYHWSSFGSNPEGIDLDLEAPLDSSFTVTSLGLRSSVHLLMISPEEHRLTSRSLFIRRKLQEFTFTEQADRRVSVQGTSQTAHNCLLDCHLDVWTRFPVQAAFCRQTITAAGRHPAALTFVTEKPEGAYIRYFRELTKMLERTTRKPTGDILSSIAVSAVETSQLVLNDSQVSTFRAGEWVVELLCLIPLHLAVTHQNRFVPLKDGVWSPELERTLLGADVGEIVDALSVGWYESLFQSYMVTKPVRVVSSMGEQSVGKSYCLNHFADTSFAGSAMRTTEGVWMSVTPTETQLVVALDFEGVHSIERSAQEDALLVLFNTAISNLVLFRNNFALSRDIAGLFTSFQSSSSVLDPSVNPGLFNGRLCIIIKDVVDADKQEIVKE